MSFVVGVVVEGKDDFAAIEAAVESELSKLSISDVVFRRLQPEKDATGSTDRGGWTKVVGWLIDHSGAGIETFFAPLFAGVEPCDIIVIHVDGDVHAECLKKAALPTPPPPVSVEDQVIGMRTALDSWVALDPERRRFLAYAIPVFMTENWIMASNPHCPDHIWQGSDAKTLLRSLFDPARDKSVAAMRARFVEELRADTAHLAARAKSYRLFLADLLDCPPLAA